MNCNATPGAVLSGEWQRSESLPVKFLTSPSIPWQEDPPGCPVVANQKSLFSRMPLTQQYPIS